ncbi:phage tail tube protein [Parageobacillus thermoglucosidasius]|uniref:phage tail tube protein n=1 Tax=Parageobacillus thermoglucosidasius TaxID=1426 RepID=UPI000E1A5E6F|nr:capsid protein [Parageobacillus thermoglucosidasius]MED4904124.1 capsid protein [Parageobacillus thermoglucosidasius]MED4915674.1 capsid protein [Parageobacillus thermoglucosidasius]MED4945061.1 capsid protein [Parageobacillus thermoglucosidasius]MED4983742.1 capsid protein [Parageobacillus thermoglucosidasius]RDE19319.1 capsid protein [Parageobacillus thermoglucosidasius]
MPEGLLLQSKHLFEINTTPGQLPGNFARVGAGLNNFEPSFNEEVAQDTYLDGDGFAESLVTGAQLVITFSGHRKYGDPAQDFIFSKSFSLGEERKTEFRWTLPDGTIIEGNCTIANIEGPSGDANAKGEISFEVHFNGKPTVTPPAGSGS